MEKLRIFVDQKLSGIRKEDVVPNIQLPTLTLQFPLLILWLAGVGKKKMARGISETLSLIVMPAIKVPFCHHGIKRKILYCKLIARDP